MKLELDEHPKPEDFRVVLDGVHSFNRVQTGDERPRPVAGYLRDEAGQMSAACKAISGDDRRTSMRFGSMKITAVRDMAQS